MKTRLTVLVLMAHFAVAQSTTGERWITTWASSMLATNPPLAAPPPAAVTNPPAAAAAKPQPPRTFHNQTLRMVVNPSLGGRIVRVQLSNTFGTAALKIGGAHVALHDKGSAVIPASDRALTFSGKAAATIPAGAMLISDPVDLAVPALGDLVVSVFLPEDSGPPTNHATGLHTTYVSAEGDFTGQADFMPSRTTNSWYFLASVDVLAPADSGVIVAFGDSITDGATSSTDANASWPSGLAKRLREAGMTNLAVVNHGISGNRVLRDGAGVSALARFERDVLSQPGARYLMFMEGINDIGGMLGPNAPAGSSLTADEIIAVYKQMIDRAHMHGMKVIGCTLTPYEGAGYYSEKGEAVRTAVNQWIRTTGAVDGMVDFDAATRDPKNPKHLRTDYNIRDNLHPNDAGYKAMAEAIDLSLFRK